MKLYSIEQCPPCDMVKQFLKKNEIQIDVLFFYRDRSKNTQLEYEEIKSLGIRSFPSLKTNEGAVLVGSGAITRYISENYPK